MLKVIFDRDTNKCSNKDITKYLHKNRGAVQCGAARSTFF